jgi:Zn-dependent peptidase ImmA (M78 family)
LRYTKDTTGRFDQRPHFEPDDIEDLCQKTLFGFVATTIGSLQYPISTDILTKLIESLTEDLDLFTNMADYDLADGVEGFTEYSFNSKPSVYINQRLSLHRYLETRLRTTLSHETGHVILHGPLFKRGSQCRLLRSTEEWARPSPTTIAQRSVSRDWMEWQANYAMGALLMPRDAINELASWYGQKYGFQPPFQLRTGHAQDLIKYTAKKFFVSNDAAEVRLKHLFYLLEK